jgi:carbamoyltransferase
MYILGISAFYHDSAAALICDGEIIAAAQEERFTRKKHDPAFPINAVRFCLEQGNVELSAIDYIVFYDKPLIKFERLLETYLSVVPKGFSSFVKSMPLWLKEKLFLKVTLRREFATLIVDKNTRLPPLRFTQHHQSHAASAFYPSPFKKAAVLCVDGVGEWATTSVWLGDGSELIPQWQLNFPHSLGLLYSAFTYYTGFKVNSGEYKLMGLAPYGEPKYVDLILDNLIDIKSDGTFRLNMDYFDFAAGLTMTSTKFNRLFDGKPRQSESDISQKEMDIARSIQVVTEQVMLKLCQRIHDEFEVDYLCLAGGVALNCVANGRILREGPFKDIWIQPAAGDAGGALGAAMCIWHQYNPDQRKVVAGKDAMLGSYLGGQFSQQKIEYYLRSVDAKYQLVTDDELYYKVAKLMAQGHVIGWFNGRMEFGPRALGARSIIGDARSPKMQSVMNLKIKFRESFRPFAPAVLADKANQWFGLDDKHSPYMLLVASVAANKWLPDSSKNEQAKGLDKLYMTRTKIPAVTHVDFTARIQTVHADTNPRFYQLLSEFDAQTGCPVVINTSFNVRGEPIVYTPEDAYRCFMRTEMDYLVLENCILAKSDQPKLKNDSDWQSEFELD